METITTDLKAAMKQQDRFKTSVLRMVLSEFKYAMTSHDREEVLDDETALKILGTYQKRLEKSLADYPEGEKKEEIAKEIALVETYLPKKAGAAEVQTAVDQLLASTQERQFGVLMKSLMSQFGSSADGKLISQVLKDRLKE
ncbi:MAG: GatB/YqeY domain-containing protein [Oligoflexus sp.]